MIKSVIINESEILYGNFLCVFHVLILQYYYLFKYNMRFCQHTPPIFPQIALCFHNPIF